MRQSGELPLTGSGRRDAMRWEIDWERFSFALQENINTRAEQIKAAQAAGGDQTTTRILLTAQEVLLALQFAIVAGLQASMGEKPDE